MLSMYTEAEKLGGLAAKMKLAMLTKTSSLQAAGVPDSPETIAIFDTAMQQIKQEYAK